MRQAAALAGVLLLVPRRGRGRGAPHWRTADFPLPVLAADLAADGDAIVALTLGPQPPARSIRPRSKVRTPAS